MPVQSSWLPPQDKPRPLVTKHLVGRHELEPDADARIGNFDSPRRRRRDFMGDHCMPVRKRMRHQVIVGNLEKCADRGRLVASAGRPRTDRAERWYDCSIRSEEKPRVALLCPSRKIVVTGFDFIPDLLDAEDLPGRVVCDQPVPECRAEIHAVMEVLCLDKDIGIEQVRHQTSPRLCPSSRKVASFEKPSRRKASRCRVWPSRVLATRARANRFPT